MADTVDIKVLRNSERFYTVKMANQSDGTGESAVTKVEIATLTGPNGLVVTSLSLLEASWAVKGGYVVVEWDHTTNDEMFVCTGANGVSYESLGGFHDPGSSGGTGDILVTTDSFADGDSYDITLAFKKHS